MEILQNSEYDKGERVDYDMKFERIDDKTVKCFLCNAELEQYEISYKDFIMRSDKARELLEDVVKQAGEEMGYQLFQQAFDLSVMMMPDIGMILTFSEKGGEIDGIPPSVLKDMVEAQRVEEGIEADLETREKEKRGEAKLPGGAVFSFEDIRDVCEFAGGVPAGLPVLSSLYEMKGRYYLLLEQGEAAYEAYSRACIRAMEFGTLHSADHSRLLYIREQEKCLIADGAIEKLAL